MSQTDIISFPSQIKPDSQKTKKWIKECVNAALEMNHLSSRGIRKNFYDKKVNYDLVNNILHEDDVKQISNPWGISANTFPAKAQNYPIILPRLNVLIGEELKRKFDFRVRVGNDEAISEKETYLKEQLYKIAYDAIVNKNIPEEEIKQQILELDKWSKYEYQDAREVMGNNLLRYLYKTQDLKTLFNQGFQDALIAAEEIYEISIVGNQPVVNRLSPMNVHTIRTNSSPYIEDAEIIIIDSFMALGKVIDIYHDDLKQSEIKRLEEGSHTRSEGFINIGRRESSIIVDGDFNTGMTEEGLITLSENGAMAFGDGYDDFGNIRVSKVKWKSRRKMLRIKYYDEAGNEQERLADERYKPSIFEGETLEGTMWINEWWEATKLAEDIYVNMGPCKVQYRDMDNPAICKPGIVGTAYNVDHNKARSLVDVMKPYQYLYNIFMYRTELAFAKSHGKLLKLDYSLIPDNMELDDWFTILVNQGLIVEDPYSEANMGDQANLAQVSRGAQAVDLEMSNYIQQHLAMMNFVDNQCGRIAGITPQREGAVNNRETVGGVERAVTQSNFITEQLFFIHDNVKKRVLEALLETAKYCYKNEGTKKFQYILDDYSTKVFEIEGEQFNEANYDTHINNSQEDTELFQQLKQLAHAGIQNDKLNFSELMSIFMSDSLSDVRRKIENAEEKRDKGVEAQREHEQGMLDKQLQQQQIEKVEEREFELLKQDKDHANKITLEEIKARQKNIEQEYRNNNDDRGSREMEKLNKKLEHTKSENDKDRALKREEIKAKEKATKSK